MASRCTIVMGDLALILLIFNFLSAHAQSDESLKTRFILNIPPSVEGTKDELFVEVKTTKKYPCAGFGLKLSPLRSSDTITVHIEGLVRPNPCLQKDSEATGTLHIGSLPPGEYILKVLYRGSTDFYQLAIDDSGFALKPKESTFTSIIGGRSADETIADTIAPPKQSAIKMFIDCSPDCYENFIKTELPLLDYVRDKEQANLHLLITSQPAGNGGSEHTLMFIGLREFSRMLDTLRFFSGASDTDDMLQQRLFKTLKLGLVRYLAKTSLAERADIYFSAEQGLTQTVDDPWKNWVFNTDLSVQLNGQRSTSAVYLSGSLSANRITEDWKIRLGFATSYSEDNYTVSEETYKSLARSQELSALVALGFGEHWSVGGFSSLSSYTYDNTRLWFSAAPAIEYDIFPYSESTRRQCRVLYRIGFNRLDYFSETIFFRTHETLGAHSLSIALDLKEPWGRANATLEGSQYLHDLTKNRLVFSGELSLRVVEGFSLRLSGKVSLIHDQLSLPKLDATPEEILLRRRELATTYSYYTSFGLSYTFGSIYSTIVNPRFGK